ncbi:MAG: nitroreductase family protein [Eubacterium sp.]|nr:nitroreductase family protein [Eubacterium sp.]
MKSTFMELAKNRYSVRKFTGQKIEKEKLDQILEAGRIAPTAANLQPQHVYVLESEAALHKINELSRCIYGAQTVLLFTYDSRSDWKNALEPGIHSGEQDVSIVATHMMLEAWDLGIASCWVNVFPNTKTAEAFGLSKYEKPVLLMPIGYAAPDAHPSTMHTNRKPVEETVRAL